MNPMDDICHTVINAYVGGIVSLQLCASDKRDDTIGMVLWVVLGLLCLSYRPLLLTGTPCCASLRKRGIISCLVPPPCRSRLDG
jgi:hypothetical protein